MQPTSMATIPEARENVFKEGNKPGNGVVFQPGSPRRSISLPGYLVLPLQAVPYSNRMPLYLQAVSLSACQHFSTLRPFGPSLVSTAAAPPCQPVSTPLAAALSFQPRANVLDDVKCRRRRWFTIVNDSRLGESGEWA